MDTRNRLARLWSVAAILIGICVSTGQLVSANGCDPAYVTQVGNTFFVAPTGTDDTANLQCALDAVAAAAPGGRVQLMSGTYSIGQIAMGEFHGSLVGAGKERTVITTLPDLPCPGTWPILLQFEDGDVRVADLTFDITDPYPCQTWFNPVDDPELLYPRHDLAVIVAIGGEILDPSYDWSAPETVYASSSMENVVFRGPIDPEDPTYFGITSGLFIGPPIQAVPSGGLGRALPMEGTHSVTNCSFENTWQALVTFDLTNGSLTVGGSASEGNLFANVTFGLRSLDHNGSSVEFSYNEVVDVAPYGTGVLALQSDRPSAVGYPWPSPAQYLIRHNKLDVAGPVDAISLMDFGAAFGEGTKVDAVVSRNRIHLKDGLWGGVWGMGANDVLVANNQIAGTGMAGIYFGFQGLPSSGWTMIGNNMRGLETSVASIWLGEDTSQCTVVGGGSVANVLDQGEDNLIAGVNNMGGNPPGPAIREAMERKLEILSHFP